MNKITIMLPAYNEEDNIELMVEKWMSLYDKLLQDKNLSLEVFAVNDGSKDKTKEIGESLANKYSNFRLVNHEKNKGLGAAVKTGIEYFVENYPESNYMCIMDCDNTQDPCYIFDMLDKAENTCADVVIASRYQKGAEVKGVSGLRLIMSEGAKVVFSLILNVPKVRDYTCGYRIYKRDILKKAELRFGNNLVEESGFTCMVELLYKLYSCNAKFEEIPFKLRYDLKNGASKMAVLKTAFKSVILAMKLRKIKKQAD